MFQMLLMLWMLRMLLLEPSTSTCHSRRADDVVTILVNNAATCGLWWTFTYTFDVSCRVKPFLHPKHDVSR